MGMLVLASLLELSRPYQESECQVSCSVLNRHLLLIKGGPFKGIDKETLPIPTRTLESTIRPQCWNPDILQKNEKHKNKKKKTENVDEIGQTLVPGALNDTKNIRKAGADILELKNPGFIRNWAGCSHVVQRYTVRLCGPRQLNP